jgi:mannose-6-phosphate isomerase-like protein (cupin superfamily)
MTYNREQRPWGTWEVLERGERFQVKRLEVMPGKQLSLQKHMHRSEHWVVVKGTAIVTIEDRTIMLSENQSEYIPVAAVHRLANPGKIPLIVIEVQVGAYLEEDDIERLNLSSDL